MSFVVAGAALLGLVAGPYVRALAAGFAPYDDLDEAAPERDRPDAPPPDEAARDHHPRDRRGEAREAFRGALRGGPSFTWPPLAEICTAAVCALVAWRVEGGFSLVAWLYAAVAGCALAAIDWRTRRLPDVITLSSYPVLALLLAPTGDLPAALLGGLALAGVYGVMWFVRPDALGFGDVKLAGLVGMLAGTLGVDAWLVAAVGGQFLGAGYAVALLATRRGTLKSHFPLGPFILLGALAAVLL
ncbi:prepilin peptidase [Sphaerisporangium fuscum]|uniref:prepilin peptidase n=1 Tax=Sphaerisporangium fuscum TaxID=2835868 RepID=UPI001BDBF30E|nr:A24 family peptidase [Sphaerisporangium fuscum]